MMNKKTKLLSVIISMMAVLAFFYVAGNDVKAKNAMSYNQEGWEHLKKGDDQKALFSFRNALKQNQQYEEAMVGLAKAYSNLKIYDEALSLFERVLSMNSSSAEALTGSGFILIDKGNFSKAMDCFERALKISDENSDAHYGMAFLYYSMNRITWAKRQIESILAVDPYHFDTLLLLAAIKSTEGHLGEARDLARKAIDADTESVKGYIGIAGILFRDYIINDNFSSCEEAIYNLDTALAMQGDNYNANRMMGDIFLYRKRYGDAAEYYKKCMTIMPSSILSYSMAVCYDKTGRTEEALRLFLEALKANPSDEVAASALEQFLVNREYRIGHPANIMRCEYNLDIAKKRMNSNLPDEVILYLRRALMLNPMNREARENLMQYYGALDYNRLYIDELKELLRMYPENALRDKLSGVIIKRRNRLYHREGYSTEMVERNVPVVLVLDFIPEGNITQHPNLGEVIANDILFSMQQFGRMNTVGIKKRALAEGLRTDGDNFDKAMTVITDRIKSGALPSIDYIVYGTCGEHENRVTADISLMDFKKGIVVASFTQSEMGRGNLLRFAMRTARGLFEKIPFTGKVLKIGDDYILVNLGLIDDVKPGTKLMVNKYNSLLPSSKASRRVIFEVKESDTFMSIAIPQKASDLDDIDVHDIVHSMQPIRSKIISGTLR